MRVKFLVTLAGPSVTYNAGQIYDLPDELARNLADGRRAVLVDEPFVKQPKAPKAMKATKKRGGKAVETAAVTAPEER